jgi:hypothetical protein
MYTLRHEMQIRYRTCCTKTFLERALLPGRSRLFWSLRNVLMVGQSTDFSDEFRTLNAVTKFDSYPLAPFEEPTSALYGSKYFRVLDSYNGFSQVSMKEHRERKEFTVPSGHHKFNRLQIGLSDSPFNFQRLRM